MFKKDWKENYEKSKRICSYWHKHGQPVDVSLMLSMYRRWKGIESPSMNVVSYKDMIRLYPVTAEHFNLR